MRGLAGRAAQWRGATVYSCVDNAGISGTNAITSDHVMFNLKIPSNSDPSKRLQHDSKREIRLQLKRLGLSNH